MKPITLLALALTSACAAQGGSHANSAGKARALSRVTIERTFMCSTVENDETHEQEKSCLRITIEKTHRVKP